MRTLFVTDAERDMVLAWISPSRPGATMPVWVSRPT